MELISKTEKWLSYLKHAVERESMTEKEYGFIRNVDINQLSEKQYQWLKSLANKYGYNKNFNPNYWRHRNLD